MDEANYSYLQCFGCGVLLVDVAGRITFANDEAQRILDLSEQDLLQPYAQPHPWRTLSADGRPLAAAEHPLKRVLQGERINGEEFQLRRRDGSALVIYLNGAPLRGDDGVLQGGVFDLNDITAKNRLLQELRRAKKLHETNETRLRAVLCSIDEILFEFDAEGTYLHVWAANEELLVRPQEELIGRTVSEVIGEGFGRQVATVLERISHTGEAENFEYPLDVLGGRRWFLARIAPIASRGEFPASFAFLARDITERKQMEENLHRVEEGLRRSDQMKSEFISIAAHELRTPLTSILGYADLLLNEDTYGGFTPRQHREFLQEVQEKGVALAGTINEMLDISRIESGRPIPLSLRPGDLEDVLARAVRNFQVQQTRHCFELQLDAPVPLTLLIDRHKIVQVLENLLSNAIKFSPPGTRIRVTGRAAEGGYLVEIADEGVGMSEEQQARIFEKFYRADFSDTAAGGLGLGMSIVKGIIEEHRGRIWVESAPGQGTTVRFFLPEAPQAQEPAPDA